MAERTHPGVSVRETARVVRRDLSLDRVERRLGDAVSQQPIARHAIDLRVVGRAVLIAAVAAAVVALLFSRQLAAVVLVVVFFGSWLALAARSYGQRRRTLPADD
jgi:4-hydroxybenzoate polyprenyltransferase